MFYHTCVGGTSADDGGGRDGKGTLIIFED
jgi:hypothetical protein